jgi:hypothetical protein
MSNSVHSSTSPDELLNTKGQLVATKGHPIVYPLSGTLRNILGDSGGGLDAFTAVQPYLVQFLSQIGVVHSGVVTGTMTVSYLRVRCAQAGLLMFLLWRVASFFPSSPMLNLELRVSHIPE